ncbi:O-acyltransferase WSD1-like [Vitis riparia]|uniref:O-acyltransferase WSD1-like n=1 Tax=Vitis riparia TaxID=96939 RepID=UPI00155AFCAF|nr:O-acyltransferase WSD1-like [Vitis riparia]
MVEARHLSISILLLFFILKSASTMETLEGLKHALKPIRIVPKEGDEKGMVVKRHDQEDHQPLSPMARLFHEPDCNLYVIAMIGSKTRIDPDVVKANLVHSLLKHPRFSSLQVMEEEKGGEMKWVPTKVDLEKHVIVPDMCSDMETSSDKYVEDYICNLTKTTLDFSKPLWDLHLLNVKTSDAEAVGVFRIHHSLGDGTSLMSLLLACTRKASDPTALPSVPMMKKPKSSAGSGKWWKAFRLVWNTIIDVLMVIATVLFLKDRDTPLRGPPNVGSTGRRIIHRTISLEDVVMIKNSLGTTVNDVMVGITQAGLSRYLNRRYAEGKKNKGATEKKNNLPKNLSIRATHFINIRPSAGIHTLAEMMEKGSEAKWGNWIGYVLLPLSIVLRDNPLDYIQKAKEAMDRKKASLEALYIHSMAKSIPNLFGTKTGSVLCLKVPSRTTIWFSNVVGPQEEIAFFGHPIAYIAPSCFGQPNALMIHVVSYVDKMNIILSVDESTVPDPHQLFDDLEESFNLIKNAVMARD